MRSLGRVEAGPGRARRPHRLCAASASERVHRCRRTRSCRCPTACRRRARCLRPIWRRRSTRCGMRRRARPTALRSSARASSARSLPGSAAGFRAREVTLVDVEPSRGELARTLGVDFAAPEAAPENCDLVVHASSTAAGLATALRLAGNEATVLELSWYGAGDVAVPLGGAFHSRRLKLDIKPSRPDRAVAPRPLDACAPACRGARPSRAIPRSMRCSRRQSHFTICRRGSPIFLRRRAACSASS